MERLTHKKMLAVHMEADIVQHAAVITPSACGKILRQCVRRQGIHGNDIVVRIGDCRGEHGNPPRHFIQKGTLLLRNAQPHAVNHNHVAAAQLFQVVKPHLPDADEAAAVAF